MRLIKTETKKAVLRHRAVLTQTGFWARQEAKVESEDTYSYKFLPGHFASTREDILLIYEALKMLWAETKLGPISTNIESYRMYCLGIAEDPGLDDYRLEIENVLFSINTVASPTLIHGDATLENFILNAGFAHVIDPGDPRGCSTIENDKAKLLQSLLTSWEEIRHGQWKGFTAEDIPFKVTDEIIALLLTHWLRIVKNKHRHPKHVYEIACHIIIPSLCKELINDDIHVRRGWSVSRLESLRVRILCGSIGGTWGSRLSFYPRVHLGQTLEESLRDTQASSNSLRHG